MRKRTSTGIKDKAGKIIRLGDKILFEDHYDAETYESGKVKKETGVVSFADACFYVRRKSNTDPFRLGSIFHSDDFINRDSYQIIP